MKTITIERVQILVEWENPQLGIWFNHPDFPGARFRLSEEDLAAIKRLAGEVREEKWTQYLLSKQQSEQAN